MPEFVETSAANEDALIAFLTGEPWPFHGVAEPSADDLRAAFAAGRWGGEDVRTFWIVDGGARAGVLRLFDLGDPTPLFDLRLRAAARGRGLGTAAVRFATGWVFTHTSAHRLEATTRHDNRAMRAVLERCGFTHEATYRQGWPTPDGWVDGVGYAILRDEWAR
ncbi:MAG: GNAT family N-acetyltransferase [Jatrophihabitans sp.]|uniref:GNAT family N-acetyltransferase n=1 Tax=Jatrophihabitans sp. TaxID=1932789 RepID=UPI003F7E2234